MRRARRASDREAEEATDAVGEGEGDGVRWFSENEQTRATYVGMSSSCGMPVEMFPTYPGLTIEVERSPAGRSPRLLRSGRSGRFPKRCSRLQGPNSTGLGNEMEAFADINVADLLESPGWSPRRFCFNLFRPPNT